MRDKTARWLFLTPWASPPAVLAAHLTLWGRMPEKVAVHFDTSGAPVGWMSRGESLAFDLGVLLFVIVVGSWKLRRGEARERPAGLALLNAAVVFATAVMLGVLKYNV
jgi:hypothetical protein